MKIKYMGFWLFCGQLWLSSPLQADVTTALALSAQASQADAVTTQDDFADLAALGQAIGDKKIVMLDELTHGEGNVFALKSRIVRYLHQHKGFDVLVMESGLFDAAQIWQSQQDIAQQAPGNLFYMYARSQQMQPLWQYVHQQRKSARPLILAGFDSRHSGGLSQQQLVPTFRQYLAKRNLAADYEAYLQQLQLLLNGKLAGLSSQQQQQFLQQSQKLEQQLIDQQGDDAGFWRRINASLKQMALVNWEKLRFDQHDLAMADNLVWLFNEKYAGRKLIVWGHFVHVNRLGGFAFSPTGAKMSVPQFHPVPNMTSSLPVEMRDQSYIVHFSAAKGRYTDYVTQQEVEFNSDNTMLEQELAQTAEGHVFTSMAQPHARQHLKLWSVDYKNTMTWAQAQQRYDGLLVLPTVTPSVMIESVK
jgi:erythromycin esterase